MSSSVARGQEDTTRADRRVNSLAKGAWALQFAITRNFTLSSFEGQTISLKKQVSNHRAYRVSANINWGVSDDDVTETQDTTRRDTPTESDQAALGLVAHRISYFQSTGRLGVYWGAGPRVSYTHTWSKTRTSPVNDSWSVREYTTDTWVAGVSVILGVEWFATPSISLLAEYGSVLSYEWRKRVSREEWIYGVTRSVTRRVEEHDGGKFAPEAVKFGLSVYW